jgi:catechol 2,3-dioxygenase-like lactoylglutathione lyase family enzyme
MELTSDGGIGSNEDTPLPISILETCLDVSDVPRARAFYSDLFGFEVMKADERFCAFRVAQQQVLILFRRGSDATGTTLPFGFIPAHGTTGSGHLGFSIPKERLTAWRQRLARHGVAVESSFTWPTGGISLYFRDPDGHLLELLTPGVWPIY